MSSIQGQLLEVTVVGCNKLKDTEWISKQDPYVCVEYASSKFRTRTCTDGHKDPVFQEKFNFTLIEGLRELTVAVWNSNTLSMDDYIGSGRVQLQKALSQGFDDTTWPLQTKNGRYAGEVRLIIHFAGTKISKAGSYPSAPSYGAPKFGTQPPHFAGPYPPASTYPPAPSSYPSPYPAAQPSPAAYPPSAYPPQPYPPGPAVYPPPQAYPPQPHSAYPPQTYPPPPSGYPTQTYPPAPYPPQPYESSPYYSQGPYPGTYPPPPY